MDWLEVIQHIETGESETTEFKRWDGFPKRVGEAVCAMANTVGGLVILGVADDGVIVGVPQDSEVVQEKLTNFLQNGLSGPVNARLGRHHDPVGWVHWIEVDKQRGFEPLRYDGKVRVRRGRSSAEPSPSELQDLYNTFGFVLTEEQRVPGTGLKDIDVEAFRTFLATFGLDLETEPQLALEWDLINRGVLVESPNGLEAALYGTLCFGRDPQSFKPLTSSHWIECAAYAGTDRAADVILTGEAKGRLDEQVNRAEGWIKALGKREVYGPLLREDIPLVPVKALREALVNAVAHRDYAVLGSKILLETFSDRIDITSPGTLPNHMTEASVLAGGHPRSRNELIANFLLVRHLMEGRGRGIPIIRREMAAFNGSTPELHNDPDGRFVRLTLRLAAVEE